MSTRDISALVAHAQGLILARGVEGAPRVALDIWTVSTLWAEAGQPVYRVRPGQHAPPLAPDLRLEEAPVRAAAACYHIGPERTWILVGRSPGGRKYTVAGGLVYQMRQPVLLYATRVEEQAAAGYVNLIDQPTPRDLRLIPGRALAADVRLDNEDIAPEAVRLAQVLPWYYDV